MGGNNLKENLVILTAREHFIAHWLLWRIHRNKEMAFAFRCMYKFRNHSEKFSSIAYEEMKEEYSRQLIERNKSEKFRKILSVSAKGNTNGKGARSDETKNKMSLSRTGVKKSEESKRKNSISYLGNKNRAGKLTSDDTKKRISENKKGTSWYNDSIRSYQLHKDDKLIPFLNKGRLKIKNQI